MMEAVLSYKADQIRWLDKYLHTLRLTSPFLCKDPGSIFLSEASGFLSYPLMISSLMFLILQVYIYKIRDDTSF